MCPSHLFAHLFLISLSVAAFCSAQPRDSRDFGFNGNTLGMTLQQFRSNPSNAASLWVQNGVQGQKSEVEAPLCTDQYGQIQTVPTPQAGEVICVTTGPLVGDAKPNRALYRFCRQRLYEMVIGPFSQTELADVRSAFERKLGKAHRVTSEESTSDVWSQGKKTITLREDAESGPVFVFLDDSISPTTIQSAETAIPGIQPLQYKGFRLGMSRDAALAALRAIEQKEYDECNLERGVEACDADRHIPECGDLACGNGGGLDVYLNAGRVWGIQQNLGGVSVESYVLAFTRRYGEPTVERRTYRNGLGNEFHGNAWVWGSHNGDSLQVMEVCAGANNTLENMPDIGCLVLHSFKYAPKQAPPEI